MEKSLVELLQETAEDLRRICRDLSTIAEGGSEEVSEKLLPLGVDLEGWAKRLDGKELTD